MGKFIVTIAREYGSGGRNVAQLVAKKLGVSFYDNKMLERTAEESGLAKEVIAEAEQKKTNSFLYSLYMNSMELPISDKIFIVQSKIIRQISEQGSAVIVGRCADYVLREQYSTFDVFVHSTDDFRCERICEHDNMSKEEALNVIRQKDKARRRHYKYYTERNWGECLNYDLCVNTATCGIDEAAEIIAKLAGK